MTYKSQYRQYIRLGMHIAASENQGESLVVSFHNIGSDAFFFLYDEEEIITGQTISLQTGVAEPGLQPLEGRQRPKNELFREWQETEIPGLGTLEFFVPIRREEDALRIGTRLYRTATADILLAQFWYYGPTTDLVTIPEPLYK